MGNRLFSEPFDQFIAVFGEPLAGIADDNNRIFLSLCGDKEFWVRELEFDDIRGNINRRVTEDLIGEGIHESMPLLLYDEPCLVALQFEYFYDHAPMFGEVKTINVWVDQEPAVFIKKKRI